MCFPRRVVLGILGVLGVFCGLGQDTQDGCHFADRRHRSPCVTAVVDSGDIGKRSSGTTRGSVQGVRGVVLLWHGVFTADEFPQRYLKA